jgi:hypothetical protein
MNWLHVYRNDHMPCLKLKFEVITKYGNLGYKKSFKVSLELCNIFSYDFINAKWMQIAHSEGVQFFAASCYAPRHTYIHIRSLRPIVEMTKCALLFSPLHLTTSMTLNWRYLWAWILIYCVSHLALLVNCNCFYMQSQKYIHGEVIDFTRRKINFNFR